jgi:hypothetical protein
MMATTIMISTRVKPALFVLLTFIILSAFLSACGVNFAAGGFNDDISVHDIACSNRDCERAQAVPFVGSSTERVERLTKG